MARPAAGRVLRFELGRSVSQQRLGPEGCRQGAAHLGRENPPAQRMVYALRGKQLVYHSAPFDSDTEISGVFRLSAWIAIDQPDTDFSVILYEIREDGSSILLASDTLAARYRESAREPTLVRTRSPLRYDFARFNFLSQEVKKGSRLRLIIGPVNSIYREKNYNSGAVVQSESMADARPVTVTLYHDRPGAPEHAVRAARRGTGGG
jgi:predicted acyl esterase